MKSLFILFLLAVMFNSQNVFAQVVSGELSEITFTRTVNKVDPIGKEFPGGRGADELVVYTPLFGDSTGTNSYGIEAVVIENKIQSVGGNNLEIPKNGFVISGHGASLQWISKELFPGIEVKLNGSELVLIISDESKLFYADFLIHEVEKNIKAWDNLHESISLDTLDGLKIEIKDYKQKYFDLEKKDSSQTEQYSQLILDKSLELYYKSFPSYSKEIRASWYHLKEKSPKELEETIKRMSEIGFNTICPEIIYGGYAIYPNAHADLEQNPAFVGWDPLRELEKLCKKYEMKLIPWVWVFFVGKENSPLVKSKPEWMAVSRQNEIPARLERDHHFFCPSRKDVKEFWLEVYENLINSYEIDGLQLDYIRYPVSLPDEHGFCYCDTCRENFKKLTQSDPLLITPEENPKIWSQWSEYRKEQVTSFVGDVAELIQNNNPKIKLSADVFSLFEESLSYKFQDWGYWLKMGYLDEIFTMSYTPDAEQVKYESQFLVEQLPEGTEGYVGLGPFMGFRPEILVKEIFYAQSAGANGVCLFSYGSLKPAQINALKMGPFRVKASIE